MSPIAQHKTNYQRLRSEYDLAFQQLAREVQQVNQQTVQDGIGSGSTLQGKGRLSTAQRSYLQKRNELADYLLARRDEQRMMRRSIPAAIADERELCSVEEHAYFLWENSGRPGGNDQANWYDAEAHCS